MGSINLGSIYEVDGKMRMGGMASKHDIKATVDSLVKVKEIPVDNINKQIEEIQKKEEAFGKLSELLAGFKLISESMRKGPPYSASEYSIFDSTIASVSSSNSVNPNYYINVSTGQEAVPAKYVISNIVIASAQNMRVQGFPADNVSVVEDPATDGMFQAGTFQINDVDVTIEDGDTLLDIVQNLNFLSSSTGVTASIMEIAPDNFQLTLTASLEGVANGFTITDDNFIFSESSNVEWNNNDPSDASFNINNQAITRSTNVIDDLIKGITFTLNENLPDNTNIKINITPDIDYIVLSIAEYADAYNEIITFIADQTARDENTSRLKEDAALGDEAIIQIIKSTITDNVFSKVSGIVNGKFDNIGDFGLKPINYSEVQKTIGLFNMLKVDRKILNDKLSSDFLSVRKVFETVFSSSNSNFGLYGRDNTISISSFSIDLDTSRTQSTGLIYFDTKFSSSDTTYDITNAAIINYTDSLGNAQTTYGYYQDDSATNSKKIYGATGSVLDGMMLLYFGKGVDTANIKISIGVAEKTYNSMNSYINPLYGAIKNEAEYLQKEVEDKKTREKYLKEEVLQYRKDMTKKYAQLEDAIAKVNSDIDMLAAQDAAKREASKS